jgi:hypothetical protein
MAARKEGVFCDKRILVRRSRRVKHFQPFLLNSERELRESENSGSEIDRASVRIKFSRRTSDLDN